MAVIWFWWNKRGDFKQKIWHNSRHFPENLHWLVSNINLLGSEKTEMKYEHRNSVSMHTSDIKQGPINWSKSSSVFHVPYNIGTLAGSTCYTLFYKRLGPGTSTQFLMKMAFLSTQFLRSFLSGRNLFHFWQKK